ncbi:AHH domain-containing protein [Pseudarthrobacter sp. NCCP-2145]|uniref:AHH domain-containing protein n=1 Tax=Pseudarthrobacter sp. NCCP-2145 TaxID=2942290 RepID=UPI00204091E4|nr:AHH domain-containing protein [Pseudarthrobacter sp. NCCP-2145]GKV74457.1 hypothetical protein NCCP2145_38380 [Pseudarthrobacter sp. NCCP-2145]
MTDNTLCLVCGNMMAGPGAHPACDELRNGGDSQGHPGLLHEQFQENQLAIRVEDIVAAHSDATNNEADLDIDPQRDMTNDLAIGGTLERMNAELDEPTFPESFDGIGAEERAGDLQQDMNVESIPLPEGAGRLTESSERQDRPVLKHDNAATALDLSISEAGTYPPVISNERITDAEELHRRDDELRDPRPERSKEPLCPVCLSPSNGSYHKACAPIELEDQSGGDSRGSDSIGPKLNAESTKQEWDAFTKTLPLEDHHLASDKATKTERSEVALKIAEFYGLNLSEAWNLAEQLPHRGRHSDNYHAYVLGTMEAIMEETSDPEEFKRLFKERVTDPVRESPEVLRKDWWFRRPRRPKAR